MNTIISTHPIPVMYCEWNIDVARHVKDCIWDFTLPGGAGVANRRTLIVPEGVATEVSDDALEHLMRIDAFKADLNLGFVKVLKGVKARSIDPDEEAEKDMNTEGSGKQLTDDELLKDGAVLNSDGSIDVTNGGKNAAVEHAKIGEKAQISNRRSGGGRGGRRSKKQ